MEKWVELGNSALKCVKVRKCVKLEKSEIVHCNVREAGEMRESEAMGKCNKKSDDFTLLSIGETHKFEKKDKAINKINVID